MWIQNRTELWPENAPVKSYEQKFVQYEQYKTVQQKTFYVYFCSLIQVRLSSACVNAQTQESKA